MSKPEAGAIWVSPIKIWTMRNRNKFLPIPGKNGRRNKVCKEVPYKWMCEINSAAARVPDFNLLKEW
ncbi:MAG: hypothetical protein NPIRA06_06630 [Nitrospirales bacterium]|nr:MAG: hypothetical protein NPIRA06_06630 [Nitrospirales bacterium]